MTDNPAAVVDHDAFTVRRTILIAASVDAVWRAVTEPEHISRWFGRTVLLGEGEGADGTVTWPEESAIPIRVEELDPPRRVSYRWRNSVGLEPGTELDRGHSTVFTFTLEPAGDHTQLTVVETGFETSPDPVADLDSHRLGWDEQLDRLVALLAAGS